MRPQDTHSALIFPVLLGRKLTPSLRASPFAVIGILENQFVDLVQLNGGLSDTGYRYTVHARTAPKWDTAIVADATSITTLDVLVKLVIEHVSIFCRG